jgi:RNA polymerase sigma-70 factor (ECF subfamily)
MGMRTTKDVVAQVVIGTGDDSVPAVSFDDFYRAEYTRMVALCSGILGRRAGADDLVQDAMVEAYRRWDRLSSYDLPSAWVRRVVVQRAAKAARKRHHELDAHQRVAALPAQQLPEGELDPELRAALVALPVQQRTVMALHYLQDLSVADIAGELGIAEGTVKTHLSRGRLRLAERLEPAPEPSNTEQPNREEHP